MSFAMVPGMTLEQMQRIMGSEPAPLQPLPPPPKRARIRSGKFRADDPATPAVDEAWEPES